MEVITGTRAIGSDGTQTSVLNRFAPLMALTAILWLLFVLNNVLLGGHLTQYGLVPRRISSLPGIIWSPFLHGSLRHLTANTIPLLILGAIISSRGKGQFTIVTIGGIVLGGALTWLLGRSAYHIGASGLVFCYFGYIASQAYFNRSILNFLLSLVCLIGYGGMLRGVLPGAAGVSWEGHLAGLVAGIALASVFSKAKRPSKKL